eukprot:SAG31_NODE_2558_length_5489_cov_3.279777_4_plen_63_part_00
MARKAAHHAVYNIVLVQTQEAYTTQQLPGTHDAAPGEENPRPAAIRNDPIYTPAALKQHIDP